MLSPEDIESKIAEISALLTNGAKGAQMKEWYFEYKELKEANAARVVARNPDTHEIPTQLSGSDSSQGG